MSQTLVDLSSAIAALVDGKGRSVVRVEGRRRVSATGIVFSADGVVITASHSLEWDEPIEVGLADGTTVPASLKGRDPGTDLAALQVEAKGLPVLGWADASAVRAGELVLALSRPGRAIRASLGVLSAVSDAWRSPAGGRLDRYVQADVALHRGFSGAALLAADGRLIGMGTAGLLRGAALAVPGPTAARVVESLLAHGRMRRGFLGIGVHPVPLPEALSRELGQHSGLLVVSVREDSPAGRAGLLLGDVLVSLGEEPVRSPADLLPLLDEENVDRELATRILRAGGLQEVSVRIAAAS